MVLIQMLLPLRVVGRSKYRPYVTFFITLALLATFFWEVVLTSQGGQPIENYLPAYAFNTCEIGQVSATELLKDGVRSLFMTIDLGTMLINMLFLWIFSPLVEEFLGSRRFLSFFIFAGLGGYIISAILSRGMCDVIVGPNSAIAGVIAAFVFLHPGKRIETAVRPFLDRKMEFPAVFFAVVYLILQFIVDGGGPLSGEFLPIWDEIGGFIVGFIFIFVVTLFKAAPKADPFEYLDD
ncbi:MAG: rhomboid family intramembrane serine protease [Anaerolineae bacterium]|nr:rhomboid family intramembrane serine protease [Anaerolineae bacterium]